MGLKEFRRIPRLQVVLMPGAGKRTVIAGMDLNGHPLIRTPGEKVTQRGQPLFDFLEQLGEIAGLDECEEIWES
jgi:hypothetical protein